MRFVNDREASATAIFVEVKKLLGPQFIAWEPETIYLDIHHKTGLDPDALTRDKLQACITLITTPYFFTDAAVFENITTAFNHYVSGPEILHEASPAQMAWAVTEAEFLLSLHDIPMAQFDFEPTGYAAVVLFREGYVVAPRQLQFAQSQLDKRLSPEAKQLQKEVLEAWEKLSRTSLASQSFDETPLGVALARLAVVEQYVQERTRQLRDELGQLV